MRKFWMILPAVALLAAFLAVPALAADSELSELLAQEVSSVTASVGECIYTRPADLDDAAWAEYEALVRGTAAKWVPADPASVQLTFEKDGIYARAAGEVWHCVCGANGDETHLGDCEGYAVKWEAFALTGSNSLPSPTSANKYFYLVDNDSDPTDKSVKIKRTNYKSTGTDDCIYVDFAGLTLVRDTADRFIRLYSEGGSGYKVTMTDSSQGHTGGVQIIYDYNDHSSIWVAESSVLTAYRLKFDCSQVIANQYAGFSVAGTADLYECNIIGGTADGGTKTDGTVIYGDGGAVKNSGTFRMVGGTISGGTAARNGGAIHTTGTLYLEGVQVSGGKVTSATSTICGGNIYASGGTVTLKNTTVSGGQALYKGTVREKYPQGGNIYVSGTGTKLYLLDKTEVSGGVSDGWLQNEDGTESAVWSPGGNIYMNEGELVITDSSVKGGKALSDSHNIYINSKVTATMNSGLIENNYDDKSSIHMQGGTFTIKGGELVVKSQNSRNISSNINAAGILTIAGGKIHGGNVTSGNGGNILLYARISLVITGGEICEGTAPAGNGGNIWLQGTGTRTVNSVTTTYQNQSFTMSEATLENGTKTSGTVYGGSAKAGGNIYIGNTAAVTMSGGTIRDGSSVGDSSGGGNVYMGNGTFTMSGGTISGGYANGTNGGNVYLAGGGTFNLSDAGVIKNGKSALHAENRNNGNGANIALYGTLNMTGGSVLQEASNLANVVGDGKNLYMNNKSATAKLTGGTINGWVFVSDYGTNYVFPTLILGGDINICNDTAGSHSVYLHWRDANAEAGEEAAYGKVTIQALTADARVGITSRAPFVGRVVSQAVTDDSVYCGLYSDNSNYRIGVDGENGLYLMDAASAAGATVNGGGVVYTLAEAVALAAESTDYVTLLSSHNDAQISSSVALDLNGFDLKNVALGEGAELRLLDSKTGDYDVADGKYGVMTLADGSKGTVTRAFTTGKLTNYGHNYRYLVVKDTEGNYSSHRIYLTVKSTVLYPMKPALNYRTVLKCDSVVAEYIGTNYGTTVSGTGVNGYSEETVYYSDAVAAWDGADDNDRVTQVNRLFTGTEEVNQHLATMEFTVCATILVGDAIGGSVTSADVTASFKELVETVNGYTNLNVVQKSALGNMYQRHGDLMKGWDIGNILLYSQDLDAMGVKYYCLCGDPDSENNPCGVSGHKPLAWQKWESTTSLPSTTGNYYLTGNVTLGSQLSLTGDQFVCIDTRGFDITSSARAFYVKGNSGLSVLNISNSLWATDASVISAKGVPFVDDTSGGGDGGVLLLGEKGNVSLYRGVLLKTTDDHVTDRGGLVMNYGGDLNIYGAELVGATLRTSEKDIAGYGGAIFNFAGYLYMNSGSITGGSGLKGGAIYSSGEVELEGDAKILPLAVSSGVAVDDGGLFYVADGSFSAVGIDLTGARVKRGGVMYVAGGEVSFTGTEDAPSAITGGTTVAFANSNNASSLDYSGSGGAFFVAGGRLALEGCTVNGSNAVTVKADGSGGTTYSPTLDSHGGSAFLIKGGQLELLDCEVNGYIGGAVNKRGGTFYVVGGSVTLTDTQATASWSTINGAVVHMSGASSFTMEGSSGLDSTDFFEQKRPDGLTYGGTVSLAAAAAEFNLNGGRITGGVSKGSEGKDGYGGGNISISSGVFRMSGGTITGGKHLNQNGNTGGGGNVYVVESNSQKPAKFIMTGGTIENGESETCGSGLYLKAGTLEISGTARITGNVGDNLFLASGKTVSMGALEAGARISIALEDATGPLTTANAANESNRQYVYSDIGDDITYNQELQTLQLGFFSCLCGANEGEAHTGLCEGEELRWMPWTDTTQLPNTSGYWYLADSWTCPEDGVETTVIGYGDSENPDKTIYLDLNGKTVRGKTDRRIYSLGDSSEGENVTCCLTLTDSSLGHVGRLVPVTSAGNTNQGMGIWLRSSCCTFNLYRGTIDGTDVQLNNSVTEQDVTYGDGKTGKADAVESRSGALIESSGTVNMYGGTVIGGKVEYRGGAVASCHVFNLYGGTITGGEALGYDYRTVNSGNTDIVTTHQKGAGGAVYIYDGTFGMTGGTITAGSAEQGGCVYIRDGAATMTGGTVSDGEVSNGGGNIYIAGGSFTINGENAVVENGVSTKYVSDKSGTNGGNIYNGGTLNLYSGTIRNGKTSDTGANVYVQSGKVFNMTGGLVTGGTRITYDDDGNLTASSASVTAINVQCVGGTVKMSGGQVDGGMNIYSYNSYANLEVTGTAKILAPYGTGLTLNRNSRDSNGVTTYYSMPQLTAAMVAAMDVEEAQIYIYTERFNGEGYDHDYTAGFCLVPRGDVSEELWPGYEKYADLFISTASSCVVTFEETGIWLRPAPADSGRYSCICGANKGETHMGECKGYDVLWSAWNLSSKSYLPNMPGYWYLTSNTPTNKTVQMTGTATINQDYYLDEDGNYQRVYRLYGVDNEDTLVYFQGTTQLQGMSDDQLLQEIGIYIDMNGYTVKSPQTGRAFSGLMSTNTPISGVTRKYERLGKLRLSICDSSQGHTGSIRLHDSFISSGVPQGCVMWLPAEKDMANLYHVTMDGSTATGGWGTVITTDADVNLYSCTLIGGTAQGYTYSAAKSSLLTEGLTIVTNELKGNTTGGGVLMVDSNAVVNMYGGSMSGGTSIYRYMAGDNGAYADRAVGGGNVYINGGTFRVDGTQQKASITGGRALLYTGTDAISNPITYYSYGMGGGVYVGSGEFIVTGDVEISGNSTGTVSGGLITAPATGLAEKKMYNYVDMSAAKVVIGNESNVYLNGVSMTATGLSADSKIGFSMTAYEGIVAQADKDYYESGVLVPDGEVAEGTESGLKNGELRLSAQAGSYSVGYGAYSIHPTDQDIANGVALNGYGNTSYLSSQEDVRLTRYWSHSSSTVSPTPARSTIVGTWQELMATAIAITDTEGDTVILINVDMSSFSESVANNVKSMVSRATGVPQDNITISASHQHASPTVATYYWQDLNGNYTQAVDVTGISTYKELYEGQRLEVNEPRVIKSDYAATFYEGVVKAAVNAMGDRLPATVATGILDTTSSTYTGVSNQYNYVRNIAYRDSNNQIVGMSTDNHKDMASFSGYTASYETDVDTTMQLVKFTQSDGSAILLANFQTHPHLAGGSTNLNITADVVGRFREQIRELTGADVLYFSGASGNVNTSTSIASDRYKLPYSYTGVTDRTQRAYLYGASMANLVNAFLNTSGTMTDLTKDNGFTGDVKVKVETFTYQAWDEEQYIMERYGYTAEQAKVVFDRLVAKAKLLVNWDTGAYYQYPSRFSNDSYKYVLQDGVWTLSSAEGAMTHWEYFVGTANGIADKDGDEIYSYYNASRIRSRLERKLANNMTGQFNITAYDLGGIGFIAVPYEMFQENGQAIKGNVHEVTGKTDYTTVESGAGVGSSSPYAMTIVATQANGANGYIPSSIGYTNGGYSTDTSPYHPGTGEQLVQAYLNMLNGLYTSQTGAETTKGESE